MSLYDKQSQDKFRNVKKKKKLAFDTIVIYRNQFMHIVKWLSIGSGGAELFDLMFD